MHNSATLLFPIYFHPQRVCGWLLAIVCSIPAYALGAETKTDFPRHQFQLGYGLVSSEEAKLYGASKFVQVFFEDIFGVDAGHTRVESGGVTAFSYGYRATSRLVLTVATGGETLHSSIGGMLVVREKVSWWGAGVQLDHRPYAAPVQTYSAISLVRQQIRDLDTGVIDAGRSVQIDLFGVRFGKRIYGYVAGGLGPEGLLHGGIGGRF